MLKINRVSAGSYRAIVKGRSVAIFKSARKRKWFAQYADTSELLVSGKLLQDVRAQLGAINAREHTVTPSEVKPQAEPVDDNRVQYREIRDRATSVHGMSRKEFDRAIAALVEDKSDSAKWLEAAIHAEFACPACKDTPGIYNHPGAPNASGGTCYRCRGKGTQNAKDRRRNAFYDERVRGKVQPSER